MKKNIVLFILAIVLIAMPMTAMATENLETSEVTMKPSGKYVKLDGEDIIMNAYLHAGYNYVSLEDMAALLKGTKAQFDVNIDTANNTATLTPKEAYGKDFTAPAEPLKDEKPGTPTNQTVKLKDGKTLDLIGYTIDGNEMYRIRDIGREMGFGVAYDWTKNTILIDTENLDIKDYKVTEKYEAPVNKIKTDAGQQNITFLIYGFDECPHCANLKAFLNEKGIEYKQVDIRLNDAKKEEVYQEFYHTMDKEYDRVYYPTHVITLEENGTTISKATVGFNQETYEEIFTQIQNNEYFK